MNPRENFAGLTHLDPEGRARMVDVTEKAETAREARARALVHLGPKAYRALKAGQLAKGDALGVARVAGIMAAKRTPELIPLCHPLRITGVEVRFDLRDRDNTVEVTATVRTVDKTGVEMEAMTAAGVAALALYDMAKALDKGITITDLQLLEKSGGKSGRYVRPAP